MAISDIHFDMMPPAMMQNLARDKHALLKMPAQVFWAPKRGNFGWSEIQVDVTLHKAAIYLKEVLKIELNAKKIRHPPPLKMFFGEDPKPLPLQTFMNHFHPQREGRLRIYFIDFFQSKSLGSTLTGQNVVLMNGQLLLRPLTSGVSSFGDGSDAGLTLVHEIGHSLDLKHVSNPGYLMTREMSIASLDVIKANYYLARLYGLIYKRLERSDASLL